MWTEYDSPLDPLYVNYKSLNSVSKIGQRWMGVTLICLLPHLRSRPFILYSPPQSVYQYHARYHIKVGRWQSLSHQHLEVLNCIRLGTIDSQNYPNCSKIFKNHSLCNQKQSYMEIHNEAKQEVSSIHKTAFVLTISSGRATLQKDNAIICSQKQVHTCDYI